MAVIHFVQTSWFTQKYFLVSLYFFVIDYLFQQFVLPSLTCVSMHRYSCWYSQTSINSNLATMATFLLSRWTGHVLPHFDLSTTTTATNILKRIAAAKKTYRQWPVYQRLENGKSHFSLDKVRKLDHYCPHCWSLFLFGFGFIDKSWFCYLFRRCNPGGGGTPRKVGWGCVAHFPKPLPYLHVWPKSAFFATLFLTWPNIWHPIYDRCSWQSCPKHKLWRAFVDSLIDNEKVASSKKHTQLKTRVLKPYPI